MGARAGDWRQRPTRYGTPLLRTASSPSQRSRVQRRQPTQASFLVCAGLDGRSAVLGLRLVVHALLLPLQRHHCAALVSVFSRRRRISSLTSWRADTAGPSPRGSLPRRPLQPSHRLTSREAQPYLTTAQPRCPALWYSKPVLEQHLRPTTARRLQPYRTPWSAGCGMVVYQNEVRDVQRPTRHECSKLECAGASSD
ncbi:hypothetical protein L227DRAFT_299702 [Lentinus tigrinus ALCF2SS1-6]|uniref:Uncharacterized protein n=1 Tax=Lentinus tigrinus ALCF2SS1-6 TaxID=1328759 RepID=A0A5C2RXE1_9APHY|nr:hypothetical protein L227DRAFT_299702 [Lentinus tigrinus ALCF2SS1-6]